MRPRSDVMNISRFFRCSCFLLFVLCSTAVTPATPKPSKATSSSVGTLNVVLVIADNLRPALGAYGDKLAKTPSIDAFAASDGSTVFANAHCQIAWCAPSRNSFLSGRYPKTTRAYGFLHSFREAPGASRWLSLPQYFKAHGYYATSTGKVFHPGLPANFDFPLSWSDEPYFPVKPECPGGTMSCKYTSSEAGKFDVDRNATDVALSRLRSHMARNPARPFFLAVGYQSPRLPWSVPEEIENEFPPAGAFPRPVEPYSQTVNTTLEWFRPNEVNMYSDVRITHAEPMPPIQQQEQWRHYYAAGAKVDQEFERLMTGLARLDVLENTVVAFVADHGQALGENNLWSMMSLLETSTRVPFVLREPHQLKRVEFSPVELLDLYPTLVGAAGIPSTTRLPGRDLSQRNVNSLTATGIVKRPAVSQITRCRSCRKAYALVDPASCKADAVADRNWTVPCVKIPMHEFDFMGSTIRSEEWRFTQFCAWNKTSLAVDWSECPDMELYDHRLDPGLPYRLDFEVRNVAREFPGIAASHSRQLRALISEEVGV